MISGLTIVRKPLETYLTVREGDGDRELTGAECQELYDSLELVERLGGMLIEAHEKWEKCLDEVNRLRGALRESVKLQSHYARLLNMHDGGERLTFDDADQWLERLRSLGS